MSRRSKPTRQPRGTWGDWQRLPVPERVAQAHHDAGMDASEIEVWVNDRYQVVVRPIGTGEFGPMVHLSIKRHDRGVIRDWRHLQRIKNELVGPECEAVEVYPAESELVDTSNQYHLWALIDPRERLPFGFHDGRLVSTPDEAREVGAKQRPFEEAS